MFTCEDQKKMLKEHKTTCKGVANFNSKVVFSVQQTKLPGEKLTILATFQNNGNADYSYVVLVLV